MRWSVFAVFGFFSVAIELSARDVLMLRSLGNLAPSFVAVLAVFIAMFAPRLTALWASLALGLGLDLCEPLSQGTAGVAPLIGPHALGFTAGCLLLLQVRSMVFRRRALTLAVMTVLFLAAATAVSVAVYALQSGYPGQTLTWGERGTVGEILRRLGIAVYSGLLALVLGRLLLWSQPLWAFRTTTRSRRGHIRTAEPSR